MALDFIDPTILPFLSTFLFVFAVVFGLLSIAKGKDDKVLFKNSVNVIIAVVFAAFAVSYEPLVTTLQQVIPFAAALLLVLFFFVFLKRIFGSKQGQHFDALPFVVVIGFLLILLGLFWDSLGFSVLGLSSSNVMWLLGILLVVVIFFAAYKHKPAPQ